MCAIWRYLLYSPKLCSFHIQVKAKLFWVHTKKIHCSVRSKISSINNDVGPQLPAVLRLSLTPLHNVAHEFVYSFKLCHNYSHWHFQNVLSARWDINCDIQQSGHSLSRTSYLDDTQLAKSRQDALGKATNQMWTTVSFRPSALLGVGTRFFSLPKSCYVVWWLCRSCSILTNVLVSGRCFETRGCWVGRAMCQSWNRSGSAASWR